MCGRIRDATYAQLALFDATVFFIASILISTTLLAYAGRNADLDNHSAQDISKDVDEVLSVFLRASIGIDLVIDMNPSVRIRGNEEVGECIAIEVHAIKGGASAESFGVLNEAYLRILDSCTHPLYEPYLVVMDLGNNETDLVLAIPGLPQDPPTAQASSAEVPEMDGNRIVVQLILCPASSPELM